MQNQQAGWPSRVLAAAAVLLAVIGVVALVQGLRAQTAAPPAPPTAQVDADEAADPRDRGTGPTKSSAGKAGRDGQRDVGKRPERPALSGLEYSRPVRIAIPTLDVRSQLVELGLDENGVMETPVPVTQAGWFRPSPPPGVPGATVIAGHVTWDQQPTVFFELGSLEEGKRVEVTRADGVITVFEVTRIGSFPKDAFPTEAVYSQPDRSELRLITCGGEYDEAANRYLDNVVVWAKIVDVRRA